MLADYIFGKKNVRNEKMAMTTPVQMDRDSGAMSCFGLKIVFSFEGPSRSF